MGIDLEHDVGEVTVAGNRLDISREQIIDKAMDVAAHATRWVPQARAKIREAAILKLRLHSNMSFDDIARHPDVRMSRSGVIAAYYRCVNPYVEPEDIRAHVTNQVRKIDLVGDLAIKLYDKKKPMSSVAALNTVLSAEERRSKLLGLDAPKRVQVQGSGGNVIFGLLSKAPALTREEIDQIQQLEPIIRPDGVEIYEENAASASDTNVDNDHIPTEAEVKQAEDFIKAATQLSNDDAQPHRIKPGVRILGGNS